MSAGVPGTSAWIDHMRAAAAGAPLLTLLSARLSRPYAEGPRIDNRQGEGAEDVFLEEAARDDGFRDRLDVTIAGYLRGLASSPSDPDARPVIRGVLEIVAKLSLAGCASPVRDWLARHDVALRAETDAILGRAALGALVALPSTGADADFWLRMWRTAPTSWQPRAYMGLRLHNPSAAVAEAPEFLRRLAQQPVTGNFMRWLDVLSEAPKKVLASLTPREREVLAMRFKGVKAEAGKVDKSNGHVEEGVLSLVQRVADEVRISFIGADGLTMGRLRGLCMVASLHARAALAIISEENRDKYTRELDLADLVGSGERGINNTDIWAYAAVAAAGSVAREASLTVGASDRADRAASYVRLASVGDHADRARDRAATASREAARDAVVAASAAAWYIAAADAAGTGMTAWTNSAVNFVVRAVVSAESSAKAAAAGPEDTAELVLPSFESVQAILAV